jgi:hypothetical protein
MPKNELQLYRIKENRLVIGSPESISFDNKNRSDNVHSGGDIRHTGQEIEICLDNIDDILKYARRISAIYH